MAEVRLQGLAAVFGAHRVFEGFTLHIRDGECFTLLGPSGCGKTVAMRMIAGFEHPAAGEVFIGDQLVSSAATKVHVPTEQRNIGVVFQDYAVWPHKTVFENVVYPLQIQRVATAEAERRSREAIAQVHLAGLEDRYPAQLSGGQQQRVALARALVSRPKIMLLDEPLTNLDANLREEMRFEIKDLQRQTGVTILYVTHDQEVALAISDRIGIMAKDGALRQIGSPHDVYTAPADAFVFGFLGVANFLPVTLRDGRVYLRGDGAPLPQAPPPERLRELQGDRLVAACRPFEIDLVDEPGLPRGVVRRKVFLGSTVTYFVSAGDLELRVQQDAAQALRQGRLFAEGDHCGLAFAQLRWYDRDGVGEGA